MGGLFFPEIPYKIKNSGEYLKDRIHLSPGVGLPPFQYENSLASGYITETIDNKESPYYFADEISGTNSGMMITLPD